MSGFNVSEAGPQSLAENSARPVPATPQAPRRRTRTRVPPKIVRAMRRGLVSRDAAERNIPLELSRPRHDYRREGVVKGDAIEGSTA
jgi:hypothetical protein